MAQIITDDMVVTPGDVTPTSPTDAGIPYETAPKLRGKQRILKSLSRISSSPSLAKMGRSQSSAYRSGGRGSISCVSLTSPTSSAYAHSQSSSYSSQFSTGFSTAPTSAPGSPGADARFIDAKLRPRLVEGEALANGALLTPTISLPLDLRPNSKGTQLESTSEVSEGINEIVTRKRAVSAPIPRRKNFNFWVDMPDEIKVHVLQHLSPKEIVRCSAVSKRWNKMCFDGQLWASLDTSEFYRDIPSDVLVKIITAAGPFVRDLNLRGCVQMKDKWVNAGERLSDACRNLVNFSIEGCRIDKSSIHYFLLRNPRLLHINISGLAAANNAAMKIIAQSCPQLEYLNVSWCNNIDTKGLKKVVEACPNLKDLRAGEIRGWDDLDFCLEIYNQNSLERLIVHHCESLTDDSLQVLTQGIDAEIDALTDLPIVPPRKFKHLDFTRCRSITDRGIKHLAHNTPDLEGLQLSQCGSITDDGLSDVLQTSPLLTHLDLEELDELTNATLLTLAKAPCHSRLEHLSISYCENLGDTGMLQVLRQCPSLQSLDMDNTRISDLVLMEAASQVRRRGNNIRGTPPKEGLRMVVFDCQNVTWAGVREVMSRNTSVTRFNKPFLAPTTIPSPDDPNTTTHAIAMYIPKSANPHQPTKQYPSQVIQLKCFYGWQMTVEEHTKRVLRGDFAAAGRLERKWADYMMANEEAGAGGAGARRRRRRAREAAMLHADEEGENGNGAGGTVGGRRRRARSGGCAVM
jgi:F-box and leucine-rich repeat protein 2/20